MVTVFLGLARVCVQPSVAPTSGPRSLACLRQFTCIRCVLQESRKKKGTGCCATGRVIVVGLVHSTQVPRVSMGDKGNRGKGVNG